jgi:hypothetical protein
MNMKFDIYAISTIADTCASTPVTNDHELLLYKLTQIYPELSFAHVLTRGGWHRTGGVLNAEGERVSDRLAEWVESESGGDIQTFLDKYLGAGYIVTGFTGKTHYFVAQTGETAQDFIQLEVEEMQEVKDHSLLGSDILPDDIEDVSNPIHTKKLNADPVGEPNYNFRRITSISDFMKSMIDGNRPDNKSVTTKRFMQDWDRSSANEFGAFCFHWVLSLQEYTDAYGEHIKLAKPVSVHAGELPMLRLDDIDRGSRLANLIHGFDHDVGFPMAWYFYMLSHNGIPHQLPEAIHKDLMGAYAYLPAKDLKVFKDWYEKPYGI